MCAGTSTFDLRRVTFADVVWREGPWIPDPPPSGSFGVGEEASDLLSGHPIEEVDQMPAHKCTPVCIPYARTRTRTADPESLPPNLHLSATRASCQSRALALRVGSGTNNAPSENPMWVKIIIMIIII